MLQMSWDIFLKTTLSFKSIPFLAVQFLKEARYFYTYAGKFCYSKLVFETLNDKLADTGYSVANYVQMARAGEGYA